jgi:hypothetical protein
MSSKSCLTFDKIKHKAGRLFDRSTSDKLILWFILAGVISGVVIGEVMIGSFSRDRRLKELPHEPYPYTDFPIESKFDKGKLEPFTLLAAFDFPGSGEVSFEDSHLKYKSSTWSWLVIRTELQDVVNAKWVWKAIEGKEFIIEAWEAYTNNFGRTAMIIFRDGKVYQVQFPNEVYLMDFDPFNDFVTVQMIVDYHASEIRDLWINEYHFSHLPMNDEPIGKPISPFWQMQIFLRSSSTVLVEDMQAWK